MPRWLAILCAIPLLLLIVAAALTVDDPWGIALAKLSEGGLWTGLAAFLVLCVVMTLRQSRASAKAK
ncbi:hypothetical protein HCU64_23660 [Methylobacterium sp. C25]|uniref:hypothetical protein n=1 Tax=Methylobacterium sp. C25 TaxID=2721622 RepID=UPI001F47FE33|nr:hypothetical protein [Methylobacterium sp. C25]MCE4226743.1 hypothetical protein [Methylobacterium sp. C25]